MLVLMLLVSRQNLIFIVSYGGKPFNAVLHVCGLARCMIWSAAPSLTVAGGKVDNP